MKKRNSENLMNQYILHCSNIRNLSKHTVRAYRSDLKQFLEYIKYNIRNEKNLEEYFLYLNNTYNKRRTIKRKVACVKTFYKFLLERQYIKKIPLKSCNIDIQEPNYLPKTIDRNTLEKIIFCLTQDVCNAKTFFQTTKALRNALLIKLLLSTGLRVSEICNLKCSDINIEERAIRIMGKGSKERLLYLGNNNVIDLLKEYETKVHLEYNNEYFFLNKFNSKISEQTVRLIINELANRIGAKQHITPHMFRHTFATYLLEEDVDIRYIQQILGHSSITITQIYTHVALNKQKSVLVENNPLNKFV